MMLGSELKLPHERDRNGHQDRDAFHRTESDDAISDFLYRDFNDNKSVGFNERGDLERMLEQKEKELYRLNAGLGKERERFKDLEEFCSKTLNENHRLLSQVLSSARESDLRPILQVQCAVIERLLKERGKTTTKTGVKVMAEKSTQTDRLPEHKLLASPMGQKSQKNIVPTRASLEPEMLGGGSPSPDKQLIKLSVNDLNFDEGNASANREESKEGMQSFHFERSVQDFGERKPLWDGHHRHTLQREASQQVFVSKREPPKRAESPEDLLGGSPFNASIGKLNEDNLLLFEDGSPIREFRKNKTEEQLPRVEQQLALVEESPAILSRYLAKTNEDKEYVEVASRHPRKGSFSEMQDDLPVQSQQEPKLRKRAESNISGYLEQMRQMKDTIVAQRQSQPVKSLIGSPQKSLIYSRKISQNEDEAVKTIQIPQKSPHNFGDKNSPRNKNIVIPEQESETTDQPEKKSIFQILNFKDFVSEMNSPVAVSPKLKSRYFTLNPEENNDFMHQSKEAPLPPKEVKNSKREANNVPILRQKDHRESLAHRTINQKFVSKPKKVWETGLISSQRRSRDSQSYRAEKPKLELLGESLMEDIPRDFKTLLPSSFKPYRESSEKAPNLEDKLKKKHFGKCMNLFK
jgi:hypothetical protein